MSYLRKLPIQVYDILYKSGDGDVWTDQPTLNGTIIYSIVTPIICIFSIFGNGTSILVLIKGHHFKRSVYTYLKVLAVADFFSSIVILLGGLSKGVLWRRGWGYYDAIVGLPLGNFFNCLGVMAVLSVTIDRVIFLSKWKMVKKLRLCRQKVARCNMFIVIIFCILMNLPYCFIFEVDSDNNLSVTDFFHSHFYMIHTWVFIFVFALIPSILLALGNGFLINYLGKAKRLSIKLRKPCKKQEKGIVVTLIAIIICFLISEIPANLVSRTSCASILFNGDQEATNTKLIEYLRQICTVLAALGCLTNFLLFYLFCPPFSRAFKITLSRVFTSRSSKKTRKSNSDVQLHVYVINNNDFDDKTKLALELTRKSIQAGYLPDLLKNQVKM